MLIRSKYINQLIGIAALVVSSAAIWFVTITPILNWYRSNATSIEKNTYLLARLKIAGRDAGNRTTHSFDHYKGDFLNVTNQARGQAQLQLLIRTILQAHQTRLDSVLPLSRPANNGLRYVALKIRFTGRLRNVLKIIHEVESKRPFLIVDRLNMRPIGPLRRGRQYGPQAQDYLVVDLDIRSAIWPGAQPVNRAEQ